MSVTLKDIAKRAGVDPTAVSAVLRGSSKIRCSRKTKEKILALVEEMGYCRNSVASALRSGKTHLIGVAMPSPMLPFYAAMMASIQARLYDAGYTVVFGLWGKERSMEEIFSSLFALKIDGIITWFLPDHPEKLEIPVIHYSHSLKSDAVDTVLPDVEDAAARAADYLKKRHFRKVGIVAHLDDLRVALLKEHCARFGIEIRNEWMFQCVFSQEKTVAGIAHAFAKLKEKPELLVFTDDMICSTLTGQLKQRGPLPELLCFRNSYLLPLIGKKMAAFDMREDMIVSALVEMLLSRLEDPSLPIRSRKIKANLKNI